MNEKKSKERKTKRVVVNNQARQVIYNVIQFFELEKASRGYSYPVEAVIERASAATGFSISTVRRIKKEGNVAKSTRTEIGAMKKPRKPRTVIVLDSSEQNTLLDIIHSMYREQKEEPSLNKILAAAKEQMNFKGCRETLRKILKNHLRYEFKSPKKHLFSNLEKKKKKQVDAHKNDARHCYESVTTQLQTL
ncbi:hypothetical protein EVAR_65315_1 [Eumeta japonica]|uniref:Uncharacterized protein n=1 Tax=Eumeta variegata TaxID=151549 RepID=A0A4C1YWS5_EUMVA|nr:hypothetical protein EVAR_65315_1 [Eumeta japonica]